jgi:hypothetical protein
LQIDHGFNHVYPVEQRDVGLPGLLYVATA